MAIKYNGNNVTEIRFNSSSSNVNKVIKDGTIVWEKPFTYTTGSLPTGVASISCSRTKTYEPTAGTGAISSGGTIYYEDALSFSATASSGYNNPTTTSISSVSGNVTGSNQVRAGSRITWSYTINLSNMDSVKYSKDGGTNWTTIHANTTVTGIDYGATLKIQGVSGSTGYNPDTTTYSRTYSNRGGSITISGTRITWTATVSFGSTMTSWKYSTNGGSTWSGAQTGTSVSGLDYGAVLTVRANAAATGYNINTATNATANINSRSVTVPALSPFSYTISAATPSTGSVTSLTITKNGNAFISLSGADKHTSGTASYGDVLVCSCNVATGYVKPSNITHTVTGDYSYAPSPQKQTYTVSFRAEIGASLYTPDEVWYKTSSSGSYTRMDGANTITVNYGTTVYAYCTPPMEYQQDYGQSSVMSHTITSNYTFELECPRVYDYDKVYNSNGTLVSQVSVRKEYEHASDYNYRPNEWWYLQWPTSSFSRIEVIDSDGGKTSAQYFRMGTIAGASRPKIRIMINNETSTSREHYITIRAYNTSGSYKDTRVKVYWNGYED